MTKIYTKSGDKGKATLVGGARVSKTDVRVRAYGSIDELNSLLGVTASFSASKKSKQLIASIQNDLFVLQAELAKAPKHIDTTRTMRFERPTHLLSPALPALSRFILPGGTKAGSLLHYARAVSRRTERDVQVFLEKNKHKNPEIQKYLNRLSDFLFILARYENKHTKEKNPDY